MAAPDPQRAQACPRAGGQALVVRVGDTMCSLPIGCVIEALRSASTQSFCGMPGHVVGVAVIRGAPAPVLDLGAILAGGPPSPRSRWVTVRAGEHVVALAVDAVLGVRAVDRLAAEALPPLLESALPACVDAIGAADEHLLLVLSAARVVPHDLAGALAASPGLGGGGRG